jgi:hypothetical protein
MNSHVCDRKAKNYVEKLNMTDLVDLTLLEYPDIEGP